jgi:fructokinase
MSVVVTIGDCIVDMVETAGRSAEWHPGGAGLNFAVGIARLGLPSTLVSRIGMDRNGFRLLRHLRNEGVLLVNSPNVDFTGVATSSRVNGEPSYRFTPSMYRRRIRLTPAAAEAIEGAAAVTINSFPFGDPLQCSNLAEALHGASGRIIVDPNPRPRLVSDLDRFREGFERICRHAWLVKLSDEDVALLYSANEAIALARIFAADVDVVLVTRGPLGASLIARAGPAVRVPAAQLDQPIVDTMGAGDATLASLVAFVVRRGAPNSEDGWLACLSEAMEVAAWTCRSAGGQLARPEPAENQTLVAKRPVGVDRP